jgi:hypothetical protein
MKERKRREVVLGGLKGEESWGGSGVDHLWR